MDIKIHGNMADDLKLRMLNACLGIAKDGEERQAISGFILKDNMVGTKDVPNGAELCHVELTDDGGYKMVRGE